MNKYEVAVNGNKELTFNEQAIALLNEARNIEKQYKQLKAFKEQLLDVMEKNGIKKAEIFVDGGTQVITYIEPSSRNNKVVDFDLMQLDGRYERYVEEVETPVKSSIRMKFRSDDE